MLAQAEQDPGAVRVVPSDGHEGPSAPLSVEPRWAHVSATFALSPVEQDLLLIALASELDLKVRGALRLSERRRHAKVADRRSRHSAACTALGIARCAAGVGANIEVARQSPDRSHCAANWSPLAAQWRVRADPIGRAISAGPASDARHWQRRHRSRGRRLGGAGPFDPRRRGARSRGIPGCQTQSATGADRPFGTGRSGTLARSPGNCARASTARSRCRSSGSTALRDVGRRHPGRRHSRRAIGPCGALRPWPVGAGRQRRSSWTRDGGCIGGPCGVACTHRCTDDTGQPLARVARRRARARPRAWRL